MLGGKLYVATRADGTFAEMPGAGWIAPQLSPDGKFIGAVRGDELYVIDIEARREKQLTTGAGEFIAHGVAEFIAQEEMYRFDGFWWSPDSKLLVYQENDNTGVEVRYIATPSIPRCLRRRISIPGPGRRTQRCVWDSSRAKAARRGGLRGTARNSRTWRASNGTSPTRRSRSTCSIARSRRGSCWRSMRRLGRPANCCERGMWRG